MKSGDVKKWKDNSVRTKILMCPNVLFCILDNHAINSTLICACMDLLLRSFLDRVYFYIYATLSSALITMSHASVMYVTVLKCH